MSHVDEPFLVAAFEEQLSLPGAPGRQLHQETAVLRLDECQDVRLDAQSPAHAPCERRPGKRDENRKD